MTMEYLGRTGFWKSKDEEAEIPPVTFFLLTLTMSEPIY